MLPPPPPPKEAAPTQMRLPPLENAALAIIRLLPLSITLLTGAVGVFPGHLGVCFEALQGGASF